MFAWGMYDLANTIFSALFVTFFFPFYVKEFLGGNEFQIGLVFGLSMLAVGIIVPIIGAWSDRISKRMPFIVAFTVVCCICTLLVGRLNLYGALLAGFFANFSYHSSLAVYNALLPAISRKDNIGWVSGFGIAMGYAGTLISLAVAAILLSHLGWESKEGSNAIFVATSVMFLVLSLPTFFMIKESRVKRKVGNISYAVRAVVRTLKNVRAHKEVAYFLLSMFCFSNAINAAIVFLFLYGREQIGLSVKAFFAVYAIMSVGAVLGSVISGRASDRLSPKRVLTISGFLWVCVIILLMFTVNVSMFLIAGTLGGAALGAVWAAQRPLLVDLVEHAKIGQFFGFLELTNKFSGILGPILFGYLAYFVDYASALLSLIFFFVAGLIILRNVVEVEYAHD